MKLCPKCNIQHTMNGKFCSRKCGNSRTWTKEQNESRSKKVAKHHAIFGNPNLGNTWKQSEETIELKRQKAKEYWKRKGKKEYTREEIKAKRVECVQAYRARKYNATPYNANRKLIRSIYENCPEGYEVDHIIAISEGGLHHEDNLQYLPAMENRRKNKTQNYDRSLIIKWQDVVKV